MRRQWKKWSCYHCSFGIGLAVLGCGPSEGEESEEEPVESGRESTLEAEPSQTPADLAELRDRTLDELEFSLRGVNAGEEHVFSRVWVTNTTVIRGGEDADGEGFDEAPAVLTEAEDGQIDLAQAQRVARPYSYLGPEEPFIYDEMAWSHSLSGRMLHGYRVTRRPNDTPRIDADRSAEPAFITDELRERSQEVRLQGDAMTVRLELKSFGDWDVPPIPATIGLTDGEVEQAKQDRLDGMQARKARAWRQSQGLREFVAAQGGEVLDVSWETGRVRVRLTPDQFDRVVGHPDVALA